MTAWAITEDPDEPFTWALTNVHGTPVSWLKLTDYGQWMFAAADRFGNPEPDWDAFDLGDEHHLATFRESYENLSKVTSEAAQQALLAAHRAHLSVYHDETFDLACQIAKRRTNRLDP